LRFYLINKEKDSFIANVYAIFLNKGLFKEKATKDKPSAIKAKLSPSKSMISSRSPSASPSRKSPAKAKAEVKY